MKSPRIEIEICNEIEKKTVSNDGNYNFEGNRVLCFDVVRFLCVMQLNQ